MKTYKRIERIDTVVDEVLCNMCGKSCKREYNILGLSGYVIGNYDSTHLEDLCDYEFDLCEECLSKLFDEFIIPVKVIKSKTYPDE